MDLDAHKIVTPAAKALFPTLQDLLTVKETQEHRRTPATNQILEGSSKQTQI